MERYDYMENMVKDIDRWIGDNEYYFSPAGYDDWDAFASDLLEELWNEDSVTGNASGSYTFSTWQAEENLCHNWDLMNEARLELGSAYFDHPEAADVCIRCYLLPQAIYEWIEGIKSEYPGKTPAEIYEEV